MFLSWAKRARGSIPKRKVMVAMANNVINWGLGDIETRIREAIPRKNMLRSISMSL